jgi:hypothetical protein
VERLLVSQGLFFAVGQSGMKPKQFEVFSKVEKASEEW